MRRITNYQGSAKRDAQNAAQRIAQMVRAKETM